MPTLPSHLPASLGITSSGGGGLYTSDGFDYSYAIGGLPFLSGASRERPILRESAPVRKQQFDNAQIPGEQSLDGWWLRSQQSFHGGAGQLFLDPTQENASASVRFHSSKNVNVWSEGEVFLLQEAQPVAGSPTPGIVDMTEFSYGDGTHGTACAAGDDFVVVRAGAVQVIDFTSSALPLQTVTTDGTYVFVANAEEVWRAPIPATSPGTWTWTQIYDFTNSDPVFLGFVKARLILTTGPKIYELSPVPVGPPAALPTAKYVHLDTGWTWAGITETSTAIYVVGNNGVRGAILKFVLENDGDIPTLTGGAIAAQLPFGEIPYSACGYLGSFVGIGTNKGVRVAVSDSAGNLTYGPLLFDATSPVRAWTARDRFLWCTVSQGNDGDSGLYRIDLSLQIADLRFPYAVDLVADGDVTDCVAVANVGSSDQIVFATVDELYRENLSVKAETGFLLTSRIRYGTLEPKLFELLRVRGPVLTAPLTFTVIDQTGSESLGYTFPLGDTPGTEDVGLQAPNEPADYIQLKFTLGRHATDDSLGAEFGAYQLKALPGGQRQRMIQLPLLCFDMESDGNGNRRRSSAKTRLLALEALDDAAATVVLQDLDVMLNEECVIETMRFQQEAPPTGFEGWGGYIVVTLRTV